MLYAYLEQRNVKKYWSNFRLTGAVSPFKFCLDECNIIASMSFFGKDWRQCAIHNAQGAAWYMLAKSSLRKFPFFSFLLAIPEHSYAQQVRKCSRLYGKSILRNPARWREIHVRGKFSSPPNVARSCEGNLYVFSETCDQCHHIPDQDEFFLNFEAFFS